MGRGRGRGGRGGSRGGGKASVFSDDDEPRAAPAHGGGGSSAGAGRSSGVKKSTGYGKDDLSYTQLVPKFLQPYGHLLQKGDRPKPRKIVDVEDEDQEHEEEGDADVTLRALEDNPELAAEVPDAQVKRLKAEAAKERGNDSFKAKDYPVALEHYTEAIKMDNTNSTYYSNRSAVHAHLEDWEKSRDDARTCVSLRGTWAKGWVRLGHALCGLEEWEEAKGAFSRARDLEPDDQKIEKAWQKADYEERQANQSGRVTFKARGGDRGNGGDAGTGGGAAARSRSRGGGKREADTGSAGSARTDSSRDRTVEDAKGTATGRSGVGGDDRGVAAQPRTGGAAGSAPAGKPQKRAVLSFGDSDEEDQDCGG